jgi:hypothetical protein
VQSRQAGQCRQSREGGMQVRTGSQAGSQARRQTGSAEHECRQAGSYLMAGRQGKADQAGVFRHT